MLIVAVCTRVLSHLNLQAKRKKLVETVCLRRKTVSLLQIALKRRNSPQPPPPPTPFNDAISPFSRKYLKTPKKNDSLETTLDEGRGGECGVEEIYDVRDWIENKSTYASLPKQQFCLRLIEVYHTQHSSAWLRKHSTGKSAGRSGNLRGWTKSFLVFFVFRSWPLRNMFL